MGLKRFLLAAMLTAVSCNNATPPPQPSPEAEVKPDPPPAPAPSPKAAPKADEPEVDEGPNNWVIHSGDGASTLRQTAAGSPGKCALSCAQSGTELWKSLGPCLAEKSERKFLAKDCERTVVMIPAPPRGKSWRETVVMRVYKRDKLDYPVMGIAALADERLMKTSTSWLKGCYGLPGEAPRYSSDGEAVEYDTIDGKSHSVPLKK
jgi:hypothetical protein